MKHTLASFFLLVLISSDVFGQATFQTTGNWNTASNWSGNNIGDVVTETVTFGNSLTATVVSGDNYTVGPVTFGNSDKIKVNSGGTLNIGDATHANDLTTGNSAIIDVAGTLIIWGDLKVNNSLSWTITGTVIIKGNVDLGNSGALSVSGGGTLQVDKNFTGGNSTAISVSSPSSITVTKNVDVGNSSSVAGCSGCFHVGGTCTGPSSFCNSGVLPITLVNFAGQSTDSSIALSWATASEINFDHFAIERMIDGEFSEIGTIPGHGNSNQLIEYSFEDITPILGANYYRLRSIDYDGAAQISNVIKVEFGGSDYKVTVYPNPATGGTFNIITNFPRKEGDKILIYSNVGVPVKDTNMLSAGVYTLYYLSDDKNCTTRFVVK